MYITKLKTIPMDMMYLMRYVHNKVKNNIYGYDVFNEICTQTRPQI